MEVLFGGLGVLASSPGNSSNKTVTIPPSSDATPPQPTPTFGGGNLKRLPDAYTARTLGTGFLRQVGEFVKDVEIYVEHGMFSYSPNTIQAQHNPTYFLSPL